MLAGGFSDRPPESKVMPLPDESQVCACPDRGVGQAHQAWRVRRTLTHGEDPAELLLAQGLLVEDLDVDAGALDRCDGLGCEGGRGEGARRGVDQATGQVDGITDHLGAVGGVLETLGARHNDSHLRGGGARGLAGGLARVPVRPDDRTEADRLHEARVVPCGQGHGHGPG